MFNPSQFYMPARAAMPFARKAINWAGLLSNTQKTLNIVNQAIPNVYQVKPMINNAKTMFRIASEFTKSNTDNKVSTNNETKESNTQTSYDNYNYDNNGPSFFV